MSNSIVEEATQIISKYPVVRRGMNMQNYIQYKYDWDVFNRVWIYNYTIETLNKNASVIPGSPLLSFYEFDSQDERMSFIRGRYAHVQIYNSTSLFVLVPPINLSSFYSLSTIYGTNTSNSLSTSQGLSKEALNARLFQNNVSTLQGLSTLKKARPLNVGEVNTINSIITPFDMSTLYSLDGSRYMSTVVRSPAPVILPIGVSTLANFVSSDVLNITTPRQFYNYTVFYKSPPTEPLLTTMTSLSTFQFFNKVYFMSETTLSTYSSLSTLLTSNVKYSYFPQSSINTLFDLADTLLYPEDRLSTYKSLSSLASYSTIYQYTSTNLSTIIGLSSIVYRSTLLTSSITASNDSTLFYISTRLSLYNYLSTSALALIPSQFSTLYTLSTYYITLAGPQVYALVE